ncbi:hypothetical protein B296_00018164 [Ensete ventricosum]|uniref:Uncharacterized protein n=1 Tax=Ensete ventricosum TaxID=4639 RepID=A0A426XIG8_ENSVE|nr:hypothetical protein B296_00018164 [Ensete ventricosum]
MSYAIDQLWVLLHILVVLEVFLFMFRFFNVFNHEKSPLFAVVVVAPQLLQLDDGPRLSLGIGLGLDDVMGPRRESARRFAEGIGKLAGSTPRVTERRLDDLP